uniref:Uncharacterized protein n=1 Tax=Malurus cyaneus samueli TaxID=2593467 RepID=A0A8C5UDZ8_9PASS
MALRNVLCCSGRCPWWNERCFSRAGRLGLWRLASPVHGPAPAKGTRVFFVVPSELRGHPG